MQCKKCGKEMGGGNGRVRLEGVRVDVEVSADPILPGDVEYYNKQLGKYSDGNGECHVAICYECYIDGLFNIN